jgi:hypothetical protein
MMLETNKLDYGGHEVPLPTTNYGGCQIRAGAAFPGNF